MEHETFWTLIGDLAHWEFELFLIFIFDVLLGLIAWPIAKKVWSRWRKHHTEDHVEINDLARRIKVLESYSNGVLTGDNNGRE